MITLTSAQWRITGILPKNIVKKINSIRDVRQLSDYKDCFVISEEETRQQVEKAGEIVPVIAAYVENRLDGNTVFLEE